MITSKPEGPKHIPLTYKDFLGILCSRNGHNQFAWHPSRENHKSCTDIFVQYFSGLRYTACIQALLENQNGGEQ